MKSQWWKLVLAGGVLLSGVEYVEAITFEMPLATAQCPTTDIGDVTLKMALTADQGLGEADKVGEGWLRRFTLKIITEKGNIEKQEVWSKSDEIDVITSPMPVVTAGLICFRYGSFQDLYAGALIFKSDWQQQWNEAWFIELRLPIEGQDLDVVWEEYISRLHLPRGRIIETTELIFLASKGIIGILGAARREFLLADIFKKELWIYRRDSSPILKDAKEILARGGVYGEFQEEWRRCSFVGDCIAKRDSCGRLTAIRQDSAENFLKWTKNAVGDCPTSPLPWQPDKAPSLLCEEEKCTINWVERKHSGEGLP